MLSLLLLACTALAGGAPTLSVDALDATSRAVAQGRVLAAESVEIDRVVRTTYRVQTTRCLRGPCATTFTVVLPGGRVAGHRVQVSGVPIWSVDDEVVVFVPEAGSQPLDGVFSVDEGALIDPAGRDRARFPSSIADLRAALALRPESAAVESSSGPADP